MPRQKKDYEDHADHDDHDDHDEHDEHDDWRDGKNITIEIMTVHIFHKSLSLTTPTSASLSRSPKTSLSTLDRSLYINNQKLGLKRKGELVAIMKRAFWQCRRLKSRQYYKLTLKRNQFISSIYHLFI